VKRGFSVLLVAAWLSTLVQSQTPPYGPFQNGMRVVIGGTGALVRLTPNYGPCGPVPHECLTTDALPPSTYGVVQPDTPVLDAGGTWYWSRVTFDQGTTGWVSALPPYLNPLVPPQLIVGIPFNIVASYGPGPILTSAVCINDGLTSAATMQLQSVTCCSDNGPGQQGTLTCPWPKAGVGNHKVVIQAINSKGTADSEEFQFAITTAPVGQAPTTPNNIRITP
jgi:hypothetical protein